MSVCLVCLEVAILPVQLCADPDHIACSSCTRDTVLHATMTNTIPLRCLGRDSSRSAQGRCVALISDVTITHLLDAQELKAYHAAIIDTTIQQATRAKQVFLRTPCCTRPFEINREDCPIVVRTVACPYGCRATMCTGCLQTLTLTELSLVEDQQFDVHKHESFQVHASTTSSVSQTSSLPVLAPNFRLDSVDLLFPLPRNGIDPYAQELRDVELIRAHFEASSLVVDIDSSTFNVQPAAVTIPAQHSVRQSFGSTSTSLSLDMEVAPRATPRTHNTVRNGDRFIVTGISANGNVEYASQVPNMSSPPPSSEREQLWENNAVDFDQELVGRPFPSNVIHHATQGRQYAEMLRASAVTVDMLTRRGGVRRILGDTPAISTTPVAPMDQIREMVATFDNRTSLALWSRVWNESPGHWVKVTTALVPIIVNLIGAMQWPQIHAVRVVDRLSDVFILGDLGMDYAAMRSRIQLMFTDLFAATGDGRLEVFSDIDLTTDSSDEENEEKEADEEMEEEEVVERRASQNSGLALLWHRLNDENKEQEQDGGDGTALLADATGDTRQETEFASLNSMSTQYEPGRAAWMEDLAPRHIANRRVWTFADGRYDVGTDSYMLDDDRQIPFQSISFGGTSVVHNHTGPLCFRPELHESVKSWMNIQDHPGRAWTDDELYQLFRYTLDAWTPQCPRCRRVGLKSGFECNVIDCECGVQWCFVCSKQIHHTVHEYLWARRNEPTRTALMLTLSHANAYRPINAADDATMQLSSTHHHGRFASIENPCFRHDPNAPGVENRLCPSTLEQLAITYQLPEFVEARDAYYRIPRPDSFQLPMGPNAVEDGIELRLMEPFLRLRAICALRSLQSKLTKETFLRGLHMFHEWSRDPTVCSALQVPVSNLSS